MTTPVVTTPRCSRTDPAPSTTTAPRSDSNKMKGK